VSARPSLAARLAQVAEPAPPPPLAQAPAATTSARTSPRPVKVQVASPPPALAPPLQTGARRGKTMVAGYFSPEMARAVKLLAVERGLTVQALIGEALDLVLRQAGKHPMGER
jgi:hypothetical protein